MRFGAPLQTAGLAPVKVTFDGSAAVKLTPFASHPPPLAMVTVYANAPPSGTAVGAATAAVMSAWMRLVINCRSVELNVGTSTAPKPVRPLIVANVELLDREP